MLVLSRQRNEVVMIGDDIEITVVDIRGDKVRLGINAPRELSVHRKEVYDAIRRASAKPQAGPEDPAVAKPQIIIEIPLSAFEGKEPEPKKE